MKTLLRSMALLVLACGFAGCSKQDASDVTLQLDWKPEPEFGGFYAADVTGAFAKHGLHVTITPGGAGTPTIELLGAGKVPFAIVSSDEIPKARESGAKVVALFAVYQTHPQAIMTRASRGFKDISDIFSHPGTLAMEQGLPYSNFLKAKYGFDKLKIVPSPFGDLTVYRTDPNYAMQCFATAEPLAAAKTEFPPQTFLIADSGYNPYATVLATTDDYLKAHPETVKAMVAAVRDGWQAYLSDATATNAAMGKLNPTMDADTFTASSEKQKPLIETPDTKANGLGSMTVARWQTLIDQLKTLKVIDSDIKPEECFVSNP
ncbi:MAG: ABC transporter substrate-binding protein [Tepidisphaeraceae bacterium]